MPKGVKENRWCKYHCTSCGEHFTSLEAFDAHQDKNYDDENPVICLSPEDVEDPKTYEPVLRGVEGKCKLHHQEHEVDRKGVPKGCVPWDVTLWEHAAAVDRAREGWGRAA